MEAKQTGAAPTNAKKAWEEPKIVLERLLLVSAQEETPGMPFPGQQGFIGPLIASGGIGCPPL